jgi:hypothetical protein
MTSAAATGERGHVRLLEWQVGELRPHRVRRDRGPVPGCRPHAAGPVVLRGEGFEGLFTSKRMLAQVAIPRPTRSRMDYSPPRTVAAWTSSTLSWWYSPPVTPARGGARWGRGVRPAPRLRARRREDPGDESLEGARCAEPRADGKLLPAAPSRRAPRRGAAGGTARDEGKKPPRGATGAPSSATGRRRRYDGPPVALRPIRPIPAGTGRSGRRPR